MPTKPKPIWRHQPGGRISPVLLVLGNRVLLGYRDRAERPFLCLLDEDGAQRWFRCTPLSNVFFVSQSRVYVGGHRASVLDLETGQLVAERDFGGSVRVYPPIDGTPIFEPCEQERMLGLDPETLATVWEWPNPGGRWSSDGRQLYCRTLDGTLRLVDVPSLEQRVSVGLPARAGHGQHRQLDHLWCEFAMSAGGRFAADLQSGVVAWEFDDPPGYDLPEFDNERAYVGRQYGREVTAYDLKSGVVAWRFTPPSNSEQLSESPRAERGRVYVCTLKNQGYILDAATGRVLQRCDIGRLPALMLPMSEGRVLVIAAGAAYCFELSGIGRTP